MSKTLVSDLQTRLFAAIAECGELIFACGHDGVSANIVGEFHIQHVGGEDRLAVDDGTHHVHIDWSRVRRVAVDEFHGEGMLTFLDGDVVLFKLYRPAGSYPPGVTQFAGALI